MALTNHGKDLVRESHDQGRPIPLSSIHTAYAVPPTVAWMQRAASCESLAHSYLTRGFVAAAHGEATPPADDPDRIPRALARWDIQAHRTLAHEPSPANLVLATRTQSLIAGASLALIDAVAHSQTHDVAATPDLARARPAITHAATSWSHLGSRWHDLTRPSDHLDPTLARAAAEVRGAYRELTHDATTLASPETIATRPGLDRGVVASLDALATAGELAHGIAEQANRSDLKGPAHALSRRAHDDVEAGPAIAGLDGDRVWVSPADIVAKRLVPLPQPVTNGLLRVSAEVVQDAMAASAAARVECPSRAGNIARDDASTTERRLPDACVAARPAAALDHLEQPR